jgi:hypothetical protein
VILILGFPEPAIKVNSVMCKNPSILSGISWRNNDVLEMSIFFAAQPYIKQTKSKNQSETNNTQEKTQN